jgi:transcriptional regulator with XRE-family HTH domain
MKTKFNMVTYKKELKLRGWNSSYLAKKMKISRQNLSYRIHNPSLKSLELIAKELKVTVKDLIL